MTLETVAPPVAHRGGDGFAKFVLPVYGCLMEPLENPKTVPPGLSGLDHLVLTVHDIGVTICFYRDVLGMAVEVFQPDDGSQRVALKFGGQKINLHRAGSEFRPNAALAMPGSADLCFLSLRPLADWQAHLANAGVQVLEGPVARTGAQGAIRSIYLRDPDGNLIEIAVYQ